MLQGLSRMDIPVILLKGTAYLLAGLPAARGRIFNDVDILVPRDALEEVERNLFLAGYVVNHPDPYDQRYYRTWMHELPPLEHVTRKTLLDVHHNIVPDTSRTPVDAALLWESSRPLELPGRMVHGMEVRMLEPADLVLHSAVHLFNEGEFDHGLRDLIDIDLLLDHFCSDEPGFLRRLQARALQLGLERPLELALRYREMLLQKEGADDLSPDAVRGRRSGSLMDPLFRRALMPDHESCNDRFTPLARWLLYVRGHYLRMPLRLLIPHLVRKAIKGKSSSRT